ncbi:uncharacterized protein LOC113549681 [Rhopalosiphum maidis]|uniref:uncharacterized protein LOC113549681 n=1 Tax=Rhopalosiphum maidis TaxID=43146 RepID=UPI000EFF7132|nr:uncharacterized protein LOC113549681 [Rhopalosiphum maidis]
MAGSIVNMKTKHYNQKSFTYVPPTPPAELIDCSNFILDFTERKFLNVGLDPADKFNTIVQVITSSRYVNISSDFLRRIFSLMGNILSFILDLPQKYKRNIFLETEIISLSSMVYKGENMLVIESKTQAGCRVLLNRTDLMKLQYLEWCIFETVVRKSTIIRPVVLKQFDMFLNYIDDESTKVDSPPKTPEEMVTFIKNVRDESVISKIPKNDVNFISQLKMYASSQLAEHWAQRLSGKMSPELFTESEVRLISPPRYSSMSPMYDDFDPSQAQATDEDRGIEEFLAQVTRAPTKSLPIDDPESLPPAIIDNHSTGNDSDNFTQYPPWYNNRIKSPPTSLAVDENDGPTSFNHSPSILDFTGGMPMKKRNVKRKLF